MAYQSKRQLDDYSRYKALECVYAITIKYIGTTFALIAADTEDELKKTAWSKIFDSSGLGGWLDVIDIVCKGEKNLSEDVKDYCHHYSYYGKHPSKKVLDKINDHLGNILKQLENEGYQVQRESSPNIVRIFRCAVTIRNKCAHGALDAPFFKRIEDDFYRALKLLLHLVRFQFVFWGEHGSNVIKFVEYPPKHERRTCGHHFWVESDLLSSGFSKCHPFMEYNEDSRNIYFLNAAVSDGDSSTEYIDYVSGRVVYRGVEIDWPLVGLPRRRSISAEAYRRHKEVLEKSDLKWSEVKLTRSVVEELANQVGVYIFTTEVRLGARTVEVVLYVGKTTDLGTRLRSYLRIRGGYDYSRPGIVNMFKVYADTIKLFFAPISREKIACTESAIYQTTTPEFNMKAPPAY